MSQGERKSTHYERQKDLQTTIGLLKEAVKKSKMSVRYEFAYVGLDDAFTFDFLEGKERPNEEIIESGLESLMKEANDLNCVWDATKGGSKIPYVLSIKITDLNTLKQGRFQLIDLIIPPFSFRSLKTGETLYQSLHDLVSLVKTLSEPYRGHLPSDANVLTNILSHGICGHEKLNVFLYLNDRIMHQKCQDTVALLDFAATLKHIPVHTLPSISVFQAKEYKRLAREAHELSTSFESELIRKNKEVDFLIGLRKVREKQIAYLEAAHDELRNGPNLELDKLQYALDLQKNEYKDLLFQHRLLEVECERYMESEKPRLEDALKVSHLKINTLQQEISQSEHTLQESDQRVKQLEQALEESDQKCRQLQQALDRSSSRSRELEQLSEESKKRLEQLEKDKNEPSEGPQHLQQALDESDRQCKQLAAQIQRLEEQNERDLEERVKIATKELEKDIQARLKKEYDSKKDRKYQVLFTDYKSKLESIKKSYKDKIEMMKQHHQNDMELIRVNRMCALVT
ncbi:hypothetical protein BD408DRAFT_75872 [Parasitella parasitica]|nr:hypothetical protein BD408DRAFT_75872 [Parasitella parasitica]